MNEKLAEQAIAGGPQSVSGPPEGFGLAVNEYLNHYVNVADAKAASVVGAGLVLVAFQFGDKFAIATRGLPGLISVAAAAGAVVLGLAVVFPRLPRGKPGVVFWEDIRNHGTDEAYLQALRRISQAGVEEVYARQNFHVAGVVHTKLALVRWAILVLGVGLAMTMWIAWGS